jgi:hypothetical protein
MQRSASTTKALAMTVGLTATILVLGGSHEIPWTDSAEAVPSAPHRHNHEGLTWPPQPRGITNVTVHSPLRKDDSTHETNRAHLDRLEQKAHRAVLGLGTRVTPGLVLEKDDKPARDERSETTQAAEPRSRVVQQLVLFSHDRKATVEVGFNAEETIEAVHFIPANEYQPDIMEEEIAEAAQLARAYFLREGFHRVAGLRAYGILAYKPEGTGFYDTRVIYISFHKHDDAPPELMAWVDLTNQQILQAREEL